MDLILQGNKTSIDDLRDFIDQSEFKIKSRPLKPSFNLGETEIIHFITGGGLAALAKILFDYLNSRAQKTKIKIVNKPDNQEIEIEGLSEKEIHKLLDKATSIILEVNKTSNKNNS